MLTGRHSPAPRRSSRYLGCVGEPLIGHGCRVSHVYTTKTMAKNGGGASLDDMAMHASSPFLRTSKVRRFNKERSRGQGILCGGLPPPQPPALPPCQSPFTTTSRIVTAERQAWAVNMTHGVYFSSSLGSQLAL